MIVLKLRRPLLTNTQWMPYSPFTWTNTLSFDGYTQPADYSADFDFETGLPTQDVEIGNVYIDNAEYEEAPSLAACVTDEESWYFDQPNQKIYVHVLHSKRMDSSEFDTLKIVGYCSEEFTYDSNGIEYKPLIDSRFKLNERADRLTYEKMSFVSNSMSLLNHTGEFDQYGDTPTPGADAELLYIPTEDLMADGNVFTPLWTGYAKSDKFSGDKYRIKLQDKREQLNIEIPSTVFDSVDFANIDSDTEGLTIPEGYGEVKGASAYCTNGTVTTGNVNYKYATDATAITTIYVKTDDSWNSVTAVSTDATNGEFVLSATDARDSSGNYKECKTDSTFRNIKDPADIMADMIYRYLGDPYSSEYFNTTQWESEQAYFEDVCLYMGEGKPFFDYIETLQTSSVYNFYFRVDGSGKYTFKCDDINRAVSKTYLAIDIIGTPKAERDFEDYATSVVIKYNEDQESGMASSVINDDYEETTYDTYRFYQKKTFTSGLTSETHADSKALLIAEDYSKARLQISFRTRGIQMDEIYDTINIDTSQYIDGVKVREYLGERKIKITGVSPDFEDETTTLTGYDITEVV